MKIAIMQPYFMPYIGYFQLINAVDKFVIYDNIEYSKKAWFNRNKFLMNGKEKLFTIPLKKDSDFLNVDKRFLSENSLKERKKIILQIQNSYKKAPFFKKIFSILENIFLKEESNLFDFIYNSVIELNKELNIKTEIIKSSNLNINHSLKNVEKVLEINKFFKAKVYINSIGGKVLYKKNVFEQKYINLFFLKTNIIEYKQFNNTFVPYLSIIDIMMFNSSEKINEMLNNFELL